MLFLLAWAAADQLGGVGADHTRRRCRPIPTTHSVVWPGNNLGIERGDTEMSSYSTIYT